MIHEEIKQKIKDILNEHGGDSTVSIAEDRVLLDDYIKVAIPDAVTMLAVKGYAVNRKMAAAVSWSEVDTQDFISLITASANGWKRVVTKLTDINSPEFAMAQNEYTKPGVNTPMIVFANNKLSGLPIGSNVVVEYNAKYDGQTLNAGEKEATAVCYMAAAIVLGLFGDDNGKQRLSDISTNMLQ